MTDLVLILMQERDRKAWDLARLDERIAAECRRYSFEHGYRVVLRPEQVRDEVLRMEAA